MVQHPFSSGIGNAEAVRLEGGGALVLGGRGRLLRACAIQSRLDELDCLLMLIR